MTFFRFPNHILKLHAYDSAEENAGKERLTHDIT